MSNAGDNCKVSDSVSASVTMACATNEGFKLSGHWDVVCHGADGKEKWRDTIDNVVTTVGKNDFLDKYLKGAAYTQTFRAGLKGAGTAVVGDTQASHASWLEQGLANAPTYTGNRKDVVMGSASGGASVSPAQVFAITSTGTVAGLFTNNGGSATKDDTSGTLFSAGDFATGNRAVTQQPAVVHQLLPYQPTYFRITGTTKDSTGAALGNCVVDWFRTSDDVKLDTVTSDANGLFEFRTAGQPPTAYYLVAYKTGSPDVAGTTRSDLVGT